MTRLATFAAAFGVVAGLWSAVSVYSGIVGRYPDYCLVSIVDCGSGAWGGAVVEAFGVLLVLVSLACLVGPKKLFYLSAVFSVLIAGFVLMVPGSQAGVLTTLAVSLAESALGLVSARRESRVSEQSHPMNLPVFG